MKFQRLQLLVASVAICTVGLSATNRQLHEPNSRLLIDVDHIVSDTIVSFSEDVSPIIKRTCERCHGGTGEDGEVVVEEGLNMTTYEGLMAGSLYGTVVEPGNPDESYLVELVEAGDMPKEGDTLTADEIEIIRQWIAAGAKNN